MKTLMLLQIYDSDTGPDMCWSCLFFLHTEDVIWKLPNLNTCTTVPEWVLNQKEIKLHCTLEIMKIQLFYINSKLDFTHKDQSISCLLFKICK